MTEQVSRRTLLAVAGALVTAGCGNQSDQEDFGTRFQRDTRTATRTATATRTVADDGGVDINVGDGTETETGIEGETDRQTARETDRPRETTGPEPTETATPIGSQALAAARATLRDAVEEFWSYGGTSLTLNSVTAASIDFDDEAVIELVSTARDQLDQAADGDDIDVDRVDNHRTFADLVEDLAELQATVVPAYENLQTVLDHQYAEELDDARLAFPDFENAVEDARDRFEQFDVSTSAGDTTALDIISESDYEDKRSQFESELDGFEELFDPVQDTRSGLESFASGVDAYTGLDYRDAESDFFDATNSFELANTALMSFTAPPSLSGTVSTLENVTGRLATGTDLLYQSAQHASDGEEEEQNRDFDRALSELRRSSTVTDLPSFQQLVEET